MRLLTKMMNKEEVEEKRLSCLMESKKRIYKIIKGQPFRGCEPAV